VSDVAPREHSSGKFSVSDGFEAARTERDSGMK
jgi:hypothetical protein